MAITTTLAAVAVRYRPVRLSPLMLADRLLRLAEETDLAGHREVACSLIELMYVVLDGRGTSASRTTCAPAAGNC
jgi:hypothetical protein